MEFRRVLFRSRKRPIIRPGRRVISRTENSNSMWGGRFAAGPSALMREINASIGFDKRLWRQDLRASRAHVAMLAAQGIVSREDAAAIGEGLDRIAAEYGREGAPEHLALEAIHMHVEHPLTDSIAPAAARPHTAPHRNDLVDNYSRRWGTANTAIIN